MPSRARIPVAGLFAAGIVLSTAASAWADCMLYVCVTGSDDGRTHIVYLTAVEGFRNKTPYFLVSKQGLPQVQLQGNMFTMSERPGQVLSYSVDVCWDRGPFTKSDCSGWESFKHTVPTKF